MGVTVAARAGVGVMVEVVMAVAMGVDGGGCGSSEVQARRRVARRNVERRCFIGWWLNAGVRASVPRDGYDAAEAEGATWPAG